MIEEEIDNFFLSYYFNGTSIGQLTKSETENYRANNCISYAPSVVSINSKKKKKKGGK